jgi:hypothetical protein
MWSKRPQSGGKGLRCKIAMACSELRYCDRPARRYGQQVKAFWQDGQLLYVGVIDCCENHARKLRSQGVILTMIDRRKEKR